MDQEIRYIGTIYSALKRLEDCPRLETENAPEATITILPDYIDGMKDFKPGDQIIILTWLHQADRKILTCHPRNDPGIPLTGVFSTRSPDRPNPIGIHLAKVISVSGEGAFKVDHLEVLDKTPVIDIKPFLKQNF